MTDTAAADRLHRAALVADLHCDSILPHMKGERDLAQRSALGHLDLPRMIEGGVNLQVFAIWTDPKKLKPGEFGPFVLRGIEAVKDLCARNSDRIALALTPADALDIFRSGRIAAVIGVEGGHALEGDLERLAEWYSSGVRVLTLTWCNSNALADSGADDNRPHNGLSGLGRDAIRLMNRLGMIVDVSHCSDDAFFQIVETSAAPVIASHSGVRSRRDFSRNLTDAQLKALAGNRGVMGMVFLPYFLNPDERQASIADVVAGIDHVVQLVGPEHVGLGSDFDGFAGNLAGLEDVAKLPALTRRLLELGYSEAAVRGILGSNFLHVWQEVAQVVAHDN
ncbi:MAG: dipeptidase [candidate division WOR-3 bacterium]